MTSNQVYAGTATYIGGMRSTYASGLSPLGYRLSALPRKRIQPFVTGLGGFVAAPRDLPVFNSAAFNFTFELGGGVEVFRHHTRSLPAGISLPSPLQRWKRWCKPRDRLRRLQDDLFVRTVTGKRFRNCKSQRRFSLSSAHLSCSYGRIASDPPPQPSEALPLPRNLGAPYLARISRDVGFHGAQPSRCQPPTAIGVKHVHRCYVVGECLFFALRRL